VDCVSGSISHPSVLGEKGMSYTDDELMLLAACRKWSELQLFSVSASGIIGTGKELFANASALLEGGRTDPHNSRRGHVWTRARSPEG
jgi:hypothetical protein